LPVIPAITSRMPPIESPAVTDAEPGNLLGELERRQEDVIAQLDDLEAQLAEVLRGLGVEPIVDVDPDIA